MQTARNQYDLKNTVRFTLYRLQTNAGTWHQKGRHPASREHSKRHDRTDDENQFALPTWTACHKTSAPALLNP
ncbi:MAG: hypothetical protein GVY08_09745 [Bacteroidetes bacterium]|nr:hypothetical protein [Bacteroidota bacterium]